MNRNRKIAVALAAAFVAGVALAPTQAQAQIDTRRGDWDRRDRDWDRRDRDWDRNDRNRRWSVESQVRQAERQSNAFRAWFERNYSRRRLGREHDNRWLKNEIQNLDEAMERLRGKADDNRPNQGRAQIEDALAHARRIDRELIFDRDRDTRFTIPEWVDLRVTLDGLARTYNVRRF